MEISLENLFVDTGAKRVKTSVTVTNSLILDYTLNLLMTLFLWSNYLLIVTIYYCNSNNLFVGYNVCCRR